MYLKISLLPLGANETSLILFGTYKDCPINPSIYIYIYFLFFQIYMEFKLQDSEKKRYYFYPYLTPGMKIKIKKSYFTSTRYTQLYP